MHRFLPFFLAVASCVAQPLRGPIVAVDLYGTAAVDFTRLGAAIPFPLGENR